MKKVLFISNHAGFSKFNAPYMQYFHEQGWQVDNASPGIETGYFDNQYDVPIKRNPFSFSNFKALRMLKKICKDNQYDIIHCHTPVGGVLGRMVGHVCKKTKVIYTAHGFHFYKGSSLIDWLLWYPIEKHFSKKTDCIVTINHEDYELAKKKFKTDVRYISGVGVNINRFKPCDKNTKDELRKEYGFSKDDFILVYCAQFIPRKNHKFFMSLVDDLKEKIPNLKIIFVGNGKLEANFKKQVSKNNQENFISFMGYRKDVEKLYQISDLLISTSFQEGFGINIVEGMATGLPVICSDIRGHNEIVKKGENGYRISLSLPNEYINKILLLCTDKNLYNSICENNIRDAKKFDVEHSVSQMAEIYKDYF